MLHKSFKLKGSLPIRKEMNHEDDLLSFNIVQTYLKSCAYTQVTLPKKKKAYNLHLLPYFSCYTHWQHFHCKHY